MLLLIVLIARSLAELRTLGGVEVGLKLVDLSQLVEDLGGQVVGIGALWRRTKKAQIGGKEIFSLVSRDFPTYPPDSCPLCKKGVPLNQEFVKRREHRKPSSAQERA